MVLLVDADVHFHKNLDEVFALETTLGRTHGASAHMNQETVTNVDLQKHYRDRKEFPKKS